MSATRSLFVGNLPYTTNEQELLDFFKDYEPKSARVMEGRGFGFVDLAADRTDAALAEMDGKPLGGRPVRVREATGRKEGPRPGGSRPPSSGPPTSDGPGKPSGGRGEKPERESWGGRDDWGRGGKGRDSGRGGRGGRDRGGRGSKRSFEDDW